MENKTNNQRENWLLGQIIQVANSQTDFEIGFDHLFRFMSENPDSSTTVGFIEYHMTDRSNPKTGDDADFTYLIGNRFTPEDWVDEEDMEDFRFFVEAQEIEVI